MPEPILRLVCPENVELEGPYECPRCGGHMMLDATFLDQVSTTIDCPYCRLKVRADDPA
jgi:DNA-directed RNA polymerase subunit RPC12/RpoP